MRTVYRLIPAVSTDLPRLDCVEAMALSVLRLMMMACCCLSTMLTHGTRLPPTLAVVRRPPHNKSTAVSTDFVDADESTSNGQSPSTG